MNYEVNLDLFKGPLDLLLYLVKKEEISIRDIEICKITDQYIEYLEIMKTLNLEIAGEFIVMAAILMRLKARELLPQEERDKLPEDEDFIDREKLIEQMEEYARFKQVADNLRKKENENFGAFYRADPEKATLVPEDYLEQKDVEIYDLILAFKKVVERAKKEPAYFMDGDNVTIDDRIEHVISMVSEHKQVLFSNLFMDDFRKIVIVVTFIAILELIKMGHIGFVQEDFLGDIQIFEKEPETEDMAPVSITEDTQKDGGSQD
jgi:segregation and condensation protein A